MDVWGTVDGRRVLTASKLNGGRLTLFVFALFFAASLTFASLSLSASFSLFSFVFLSALSCASLAYLACWFSNASVAAVLLGVYQILPSVSSQQHPR